MFDLAVKQPTDLIAMREEVMQQLNQSMELMQRDLQLARLAQIAINDNVQYAAMKVYGTDKTLQALLMAGMREGMMPDAQQFYLALRHNLFASVLQATQISNEGVLDMLQRSLEEGLPEEERSFIAQLFSK